jgi:hypothetical protein
MRRGRERVGVFVTVAPVLFVIFNRPDTTARVMEEIRKARASRLYVAADGPREAHGEEQLCEEARRIATEADWECEVRTFFQSRNLGCRLGPSTAIDWFFDHEEEGIILEDDCVPDQSFFYYCTELLDRYRHDERIMCISGNNFQRGREVTPYSYYFSRYFHTWGWASWRRAWRLYDSDMSSWSDLKQLGALDSWGDGDPTFTSYWTEIFDRCARREIDTWDYQWMFTCWAQHGLTCLPVKNLVENVGFGPNATHTRSVNGPGSNLPSEELEFPLRHPLLIARNVEADRFTHISVFDVKPESGSRRNSVVAAARELVEKVPFARMTLAQLSQWWTAKATDAH